MTADIDWDAKLRALDPSDWPDFLGANSGLPGPRANLALVAAVVRVAEPSVIAALEEAGDEYALMCVAASLGERSDDADVLARVRVLAADERWRVREGVVIGLQMLGDRDIAALVRVATAWAGETDPLLQRAAVAAICEPRLLHDPRAVQAALDACATTTAQLAALPDDRRRAPDARVLRQALGYCWSVVVAADPGLALDDFLALDTDQPDVAWIVKENRRKSRLARVLQKRS